VAEENEQTNILREILKWTRFAGTRQVKEVLESVLNTPEKKLAYQLSDGSQGSREVAKLSGVGGHPKVLDLWKDWRKQGLGDTVGVQRGDRFKRAFDLNDFGIEYPTMQKPAPLQQPTTPVAQEKYEAGRSSERAGP